MTMGSCYGRSLCVCCSAEDYAVKELAVLEEKEVCVRACM